MSINGLFEYFKICWGLQTLFLRIFAYHTLKIGNELHEQQ